jgi:hypothetical protein
MKQTAIQETKHLGVKTPIFDFHASELNIDDVSYAMNYVLRNGKYIAFNFQQLVAQPLVNNFPGFIDFIRTGTGVNFYMLAGRSATTHTVQAFDGTTWSDISNAGGYSLAPGDELLWTGTTMGGIPVITNPAHYPEYWSPIAGAQKMQFLKYNASSTFKDQNIRAKVIRTHNNFLFALNLIEGGIPQPTAYRWSHPADVNSLPVSWDFTDASIIASKESVEDSSWPIIDGLTLRNEFCIYTARGIYLLSPTGSDPAFARRVLSKTHGLLTTNAVVEVAGSHYFLSSGDILINDGSSIVSVLESSVKNYLKNTLSATAFDNCFAKLNHNTKEVWFFVVQEGFIYPNKAFIINYITGTVSIRDLTGAKVNAALGVAVLDDGSWESYNNITWEETDNNWDTGPASLFFDSILTCDVLTGAINTLELNDYSSNLNTIVERNNLSFEGVKNAVSITRVYPHISADAPVLVELGSHDVIGGPIRWKPGVSYDPRLSRKVDVVTTGKLHAWRVSSIGAQPFELFGMDFEYINQGRV